MKPVIRSHSPLSDLPIEILLIIFKEAAQPTFSQREKYDNKNPYSTALSLCLVSRLVRRTILPDFLHTILLRRRRSVEKFANALLMQKAYAEKQSDLFFDYTSVVQRMWICDAFDYSLNAQAQSWDSWMDVMVESHLKEIELKRNMSVLLPVILAAPALVIDRRHLKLVLELEGAENAWSSRTDHNISGQSTFSGKTKSLTIIRQSINHVLNVFRNISKGSVFLASIQRLTYLTDLAEDSCIFRGISSGVDSPKNPLSLWMRDLPWAHMKSLETFSVVYPHLPAPYDFQSYVTRGLDLHVERLTVSAALYKQGPESFPWVTPPFPVTDPGTKRTESDGLSFEVSRDKTHLTQAFCSWDKAWASGLTDG
ncbi:uncharacterized protein F5147DRAFT_792708 [Suillus discolor]|uniref:Uncharacterized protein n=1 Tax=Suillus discolor TaxID=1912936 RepID=A0A9P7JW92_9AGAM|nr:uncharacterized protein F5147DRAFT_792708 [Suillus discolor]KAG2112018.1 hypothetical protein F5147DRAFT_792708 [Suillus discolor]